MKTFASIIEIIDQPAVLIDAQFNLQKQNKLASAKLTLRGREQSFVPEEIRDELQSKNIVEFVAEGTTDDESHKIKWKVARVDDDFYLAIAEDLTAKDESDERLLNVMKELNDQKYNDCTSPSLKPASPLL